MPASDAKQEVKAVEVNAQRASVVDERRESAAAKIIIGRDEIEKYGDSQLVDVLRRLPSVTVGSGGSISMRGMGAGYTQILIDGQRVAPGFSIDQLSPELVERIEILRAPTAEFGTRAIAGTINIVLRKPRRKQEDDAKLGASTTSGKLSDDVSWTRNDSLGLNGTYNITVALRENRDGIPNSRRVYTVNTDTDALLLDRRSRSDSDGHNQFASISSQAQWKWSDGTEFSLQPFALRGRISDMSHDSLQQLVGAVPPPYATSEGYFLGNFNSARFTSALIRRIDEATSYELRAGSGLSRRHLESADRQYDTVQQSLLTQINDSRSRDLSWNAAAKLIHNFSETNKLLGGVEIERVRRVDHTTVLLNGVPQLAEFGSELDVSTMRRAAFLQQEWDPATNWSANVGGRWEGFETRSNNNAGSGLDAVKNTSSVFSPLAHLVWRFNAPKKDQFRLSITQSYQTPGLFSLIPRPRLDATYPVPGSNTAAYPDYAGNPSQKPERANGLDFAYEHYTASDGVVTINFFMRRIRDVVRNTIELESVSWANVPRFVQRPRNLGTATSNGIEMDAKLKLTEIIPGAAPVDLRANISLFDSKVDSVPGPNNRLAGQPRAKGNAGADYRFQSVPLSVGGTISYTPASTIQTTSTQQNIIGASRSITVYGLWTITPSSKLRLTVSELFHRAVPSTSIVISGKERQATFSPGTAHPTIALRWEQRL